MRTLPKAPKRLFLEIGMLAFWVPVFGKSWKMCQKRILKSIEKLSEIGQHPRKWADDEWRKDKIWLRTFSKGSRAINP